MQFLKKHNAAEIIIFWFYGEIHSRTQRIRTKSGNPSTAD